MRQSELLEAFRAAKGWRHEVISAISASRSETPQEGTAPASRNDPAQAHPAPRADAQGSAVAVRLGTDLRAGCEIQNIEIVIINKGDPPSFEEELAQDVIEIITVSTQRAPLRQPQPQDEGRACSTKS